MNRRIIVEKKREFDIESRKKYEEIARIIPIDAVKIYHIYDIFNISEQELKPVVNSILTDPVTDIIHYEISLQNPHFAIEALSGQYDQRADWTEQCITLLTGNENIIIQTGKLIELIGIKEDTDINKVKKHLINPIESREKNLSRLRLQTPNEPEPIPIHNNFIHLNDKELATFHKEGNFSFDLADIKHIQTYFKKEQRNPTDTELKVLDVYWSDHCRHTTFETHLKNIRFCTEAEHLQKIFESYLSDRKELGRNEKPVTLMDIATMGAKILIRRGLADDVVQSSENNACTLKIPAEYDDKKENWYLLFKNETHNHPTEIEPYGGASTCIGGAIRDPLSGRAYVYQALRLSGAADILEPIAHTMEGKLPQRTITTQAALGYASYGNQIGLATTLVDEVYHPGYKAKRMEVGAVVAAVPEEAVIRKEPEKGDLILLIGGATGRDGIGGATGSSKVQEKEKYETLSAQVQKGNPITERKLQRLFGNKKLTRLIKKCNDFGAGGVAVAIGEIAEAIDIHLDTLPTKYIGLNGTELAISESQERMAVVIAQKDMSTFQALCYEENIQCTNVAVVTDTGRLRMFWKNTPIVDIKRTFLNTNGVPKYQNVNVNSFSLPNPNEEVFSTELFYKLLKDLNIASKKGLSEIFDASVGGTTVLMPLGGRTQRTPPEGSVQTLPIRNANAIQTVSALTWGFDPYLSTQNPALGAAYAVVASAMKICALGGDYKKIRLSFQEYFRKSDACPIKWSYPFMALLGAYDAQKQFGIPAIGGKDSMSGTYKEINVPHTLISFAVVTEQITNIISPELKKDGNYLYYYRHIPSESGFPDYNSLKTIMDFVYKNISIGHIVAAKTIDKGGVAVALAKMCFGNNLGAHINIEATNITNENIGSLLIESNIALTDKQLRHIGFVTQEPVLKINTLHFPLATLNEVWQSTFEPIFPSKDNTEYTKNTLLVKNHTTNSIKKYGKGKIAQPKIFIPVFPGTNCEYESANAFERVGGKVLSVPMVNLQAKDIKKSLALWAEQLHTSQILMLAGGFSAADEPDGSAKFIVNILKTPIISDAIHKLLERDGLILGICNGFQALIKSGLLTYGKITDISAADPTLTFNTIGRHISQMVTVRVVSDKSPWLSGMSGHTYTLPVSHSEGRFIASPTALKKLNDNGQIATTYIGNDGLPATRMPDNPNGSLNAIEGITSPCGRIFGRMGHPERYKPGLMKNIPQANYHDIFQNAIQYFL